MSTKKDFNVISMILYFIAITIVMCLLCVIFYFKPYSSFDIKIIGTLGVITVLIGAFQLISNKIEVGFIYGRAWGWILMASCVLLLAPIGALNQNKMISAVYENDFKKVMQVKKDILDGDYELLDDVRVKYEFVSYENLVKDLSKVEKPGIIFYYDNDTSKASIDGGYEALSGYHHEISKVFDLESEIDTEIVILENLSTAEMYNASVGGFLNIINNKIYILNKHSLEYMSEEEIEEYEKYLGYLPELEDSFESILVHEYTHKLTSDLLKKHNIDPLTLPTWFYEGIAVYSENRYKKKDMPLKTGRLGDLRDNKNYSGTNAVGYYDRAGILINYLLKTYGDDILVRVVESMDEETDIYRGLKKVTDKSFEELTEEIYS